MDVREGDTVHLRMTVHRVSGDLIKFKCSDGTLVEGLKEHIAKVEPRPIAVGDTVRASGEGWESPYYRRMEVLAVSKGKAWCLSGGYDYIIEVENLERVSDL